MAQQQQPQADAQVLIVGGGIGGLTLAAICRRIGVSCKVLERQPAVTPAGAGISLAPNALRVLDQLGLYDLIVRPQGQPLRSILIHRNDTRWRALCFDMEPWYGYPVYSIERHCFHHALYEAAGGSDAVVLGAKVEDVVDDADAALVRAVTADGRVFSGELLVAADGIRSVIRRILARKHGLQAANTISFTGRVHMSGYTAPLEHLGPEHLGVANWVLYDDSILTTWPCRDNRQWFIGVKTVDPSSVKSDRSVWEGTTRKDIEDVYGDKFHPFAKSGRFKDITGRAERIVASNVFSEVSFPSMASGRVALLGDAAHSMTSFFGQGACQAIEDATVLGSLLNRHFNATPASRRRAADVEALLKQYAATREVRAKQVADFSASYARVHTASLPYGLGPMVRKLVYGWLPEWMWMWYLKWLYGYQPIVEGLKKDQ